MATDSPRTVDELVREFYDVILRVDAALARKLLIEYRRREAALGGDIRSVAAAIRQAERISDAGKWAAEDQTVARLLAAAQSQMSAYAAFAASIIEDRRRELIKLALEHNEKLTYASIVGNAQITPAAANSIRAAFTAIPTDAVRNMVAALQPDSAVQKSFARFGDKAANRISEALIEGVTRGQGAEQIARSIRESVQGSATTSMTIARTEPMRAYRAASIQRYRANPKVYAGWTWKANLDTRTCPVCFGLHNSVHALDEDFGTHPRCRCRPIPITRPLAEILGRSDDETLELEARVAKGRAQNTKSGPEIFDKLTPSQQDAVLGKVKGRAYRDREIRLEDAIRTTHDPEWGVTRSTGSLKHALRQHRLTAGRSTPEQRIAATLRGESVPVPANRKKVWTYAPQEAQWGILHRELAPYGLAPSKHLIDNVSFKVGEREWLFDRMPEIGSAVERAALIPGQRTVIARRIINHQTMKPTWLSITVDANHREIITVYPIRKPKDGSVLV